MIADGPGWEGLGDLVARAATLASDPLNHARCDRGGLTGCPRVDRLQRVGGLELVVQVPASYASYFPTQMRMRFPGRHRGPRPASWSDHARALRPVVSSPAVSTLTQLATEGARPSPPES